MNRLRIVAVAALLAVGAFFVARAVLRHQLIGEDERAIREFYPHYLRHLAVAKDFLEDSPFIVKARVDGGMAWTQPNRYAPSSKRLPPIAEEPMSVVQRLSDKVLFLERAVGTVDTVSEDSRTSAVYETVTSFIKERLLPKPTPERADAVGLIPEDKIVVLDAAASRKCALTLDGCWDYFWSRPAPPEDMAEVESPRGIFEMARDVNRRRNHIEELDAPILAGAALAAGVVLLSASGVGHLVIRRGSQKPAPSTPHGLPAS